MVNGHGLGGRLLAAAAAAVALALGSTTPAHARTEVLHFSADGTHWSAAAPSSLFHDEIVLVPGDSVARTLHLRNVATSTGVLSIGSTSTAASSGEAADAFGISIAITEHGAPALSPERRTVSEIHRGDAPAARIRIDPREEVAVTVTVDLDPATTHTVAQASTLDLALDVEFADAAGQPGTGEDPAETDRDDSSGEGPARTFEEIPLFPRGSAPHGAGEHSPCSAGCSATSPSGDLAMTGFQRWAVVVAGVLMLLGAALVTVRGRSGARR